MSALAIAAWLVGAISTAGPAPPEEPDTTASSDLEHLNPALADDPYRLDPGPRPYLRRLAFTPAFGTLGANRLFAMRVAYNPNEWLGYEGAIGHNTGRSVHALLHTVSAVLRRPLPWRAQPYVTAGYGMLMVFPGESLNADPVTKNAIVFGAGLELYVRNDVALRGEVRRATVFGGAVGQDDSVTLGYGEATIGLSFYRTLGDGSR